MTERIKVLYFIDRMLKGGIQALVVEIAKNVDKEKIQLDFLLLDDGNHYELEDVLKEYKCNIYKLNGIWVKNVFDFFKYKKAVDDFFKTHNDYKVVHMHASSKNYMILKKAKKYGIPIRIAHSHNIDFQTKNVLKKICGNMFKIPLKKYATNYFACGKLAGRWLFGDKIINSDKFVVIHNAIDYNKFRFDQTIRDKIRKELEISENEILFGNVGRFTNQKNHEFLIDIMYEINKINSNTKLVLIGTGEKESIIKQKIRELNLEKVVIILGFKNNVYDYMKAMDVFLLPSKYEGLPVVGIEAQASGLPMFASKDVVTDELKITNLLKFISLDKSAKEWAEEILSSNLNRMNTEQDLRKNGYFIQDTVSLLEKFYLNS